MFFTNLVKIDKNYWSSITIDFTFGKNLLFIDKIDLSLVKIDCSWVKIDVQGG